MLLLYNQSAAWRKLRQPCFKCGGGVCLTVPGGRKCQAVFCADLPPLLLALGAKLFIGGPGETYDDQEALEQASAAVIAAARPVANIGSRPGHRKKMAGILLERIITDLRDKN